MKIAIAIVAIIDLVLVAVLLTQPRLERADISCKVPYSIEYCQKVGGIR